MDSEDKRVFQIKGFGQAAGQHTFSLATGKKGPAPSPVAVAAAAAKGQKIPTSKPETPSEKITIAAYFKKQYNKVVDPVSPPSYRLRLLVRNSSRYLAQNMPVVELAGGQMVPIECIEVGLPLFFLRPSFLDLTGLAFHSFFTVEVSLLLNSRRTKLRT